MITNSFDPYSKPFLRAEDLYETATPNDIVTLVTFKQKVVDTVIEQYKGKLECSYNTTNGKQNIYSFFVDDKKYFIYMTGIGATLSSILMKEVSVVTGSHKFVFFGSCGVLNEEICRGKIIVPTSIYREEGYSYHYAPPSKYMPIKNHETVAKFIDSLGYPVVSGKGWTTDAMLNETRAKVAARKEEGVLCVDMEGSGLQAIADHLGLELYLFFFSGDIVQDEWVRGDLGGEEERRRQSSAVEVALELGKSLANAE